MKSHSPSSPTREIDFRIPAYLQLVLNRVMAEHLDQTSEAFYALGINIQKCRALLALHHHRHVRPGALAYLIGFDQTAISHLLKSMAAQGLISRKRDESDNRAVTVRLTSKGKRLAAQCHTLAQTHEDLLLSGLSEKEVNFLRKIVWKIDEKIRGPRQPRVAID